jgi:hypothetical protein
MAGERVGAAAEPSELVAAAGDEVAVVLSHPRR